VGILKKAKKIDVTHEVDYASLEEILVNVKSGKITVAEGLSQVNNLYEATARFMSLHHSQMGLELAGRHLDMIENIVSEQHNDFQDLIKAIKDK